MKLYLYALVLVSSILHSQNNSYLYYIDGPNNQIAGLNINLSNPASLPTSFGNPTSISASSPFFPGLFFQISGDGRYAYIASSGVTRQKATIEIYDLCNNQCISTVSPNTSLTSPSYAFLVLSPDHSKLCATVVDNTVSHMAQLFFYDINGTQLNLISQTNPFAINEGNIGNAAFRPSSNYVYLVVPLGANCVLKQIDFTSGAIQPDIALGPTNNQQGLAITPDGLKAYILNTGGFGLPNGNSISVVNLTNGTITDTITNANLDEPYSCCMATFGGKSWLYVGNLQPAGMFNIGSIVVIDTTTDTVSAAILGSNFQIETPTSLAVDPTQSIVYIGNRGNNGLFNSVSALNTSNNTILWSYPISGNLGQSSVGAIDISLTGPHPRLLFKISEVKDK